MLTLVMLIVGAGVLFLVVVSAAQGLEGWGGKPLPDLPPDGGRVSAVELKSITKGGSALSGAGDRQSGGFLELTSERLRSGNLVVFDVPYAEIESVHTEAFGLTKIVIVALTGDRKSLAATLKRAEVPRVLDYLSRKSVSIRDRHAR